MAARVVLVLLDQRHRQDSFCNDEAPNDTAELGVSQTKVTQASVAKLEKALPDCNIYP